MPNIPASLALHVLDLLERHLHRHVHVARDLGRRHFEQTRRSNPATSQAENLRSACAKGSPLEN